MVRGDRNVQQFVKMRSLFDMLAAINFVSDDCKDLSRNKFNEYFCIPKHMLKQLGLTDIKNIGSLNLLNFKDIIDGLF